MFEVKHLDRSIESFKNSEDYVKSFQAWHKTWTPEISAIKEDFILSADNFTRQDYVVSLFWQGECAGLTFMSAYDLSSPIARFDSYFSSWPNNLMENIAAEYRTVLVASSFTVNKSHQGQGISGVPFKDLVMAAGIDFYLNSNFKLMLGTMRNLRKANGLAYKFGAKSLGTVICNGEPSDMVAFDRHTLPAFPPEIRSLIERGLNIGKSQEAEAA